MLALIDADIIVYEAGHASQETHDFGDGQLMATANKEDAFHHADAYISDVVETLEDKFGSVGVVLALSDPDDCFRWDFWPDYKSGRKGVHRPITYPFVREYLAEHYRTIQRPRLEGDDVMGILATTEVRGLPPLAEGRVIVSVDKDMRTIPGYVYDPKKRKMATIDEHEADWNFMIQVLTGDRVDGYFGCPGIGPVRAARVLEPLTRKEWWPAVVETYAKHDLDEAYALSQARCARILRGTDYNFKTKEVIPWTPPSSR